MPAEPPTHVDDDLARREALFQSLVVHAAAVILVVDEERRLSFAPPAAAEITGYPLEELVGMDVLDLVHPEDVTTLAKSFAETAARPGIAVPLRFRVMTRTGASVPVEATASNRLGDPSVSGVVITVRDLATGAGAASVRELDERRFRKMIENISDTVTLVGADGQILDSTGQVKEILGYPSDFWDPRSAFDLAHPDDLGRAHALFDELVGNPGGQASHEFRARHADGSWAMVELTAVNLLEDPDVGAIVITSRNVTERDQTSRELAAARDQALQALQQKIEFVASVSHELRTPIHGILGLVELLAGSNLDPEALELATSIGRATESLRMVLDDLLDFSKIEAGHLDLDDQPVALSEILADVRALFRSQSEQKGIALALDVGEGFPPLIRGDALRLRQVVSNLVGNAVKFTDQGGVGIEARSHAGPGGAVSVRVAVSDTGIGISEEERSRLFEPFSQARRSTARRFGGTGLGLTIARRLVELMGGELLVESEPGIGSTFWFVLPEVELAADGEVGGTGHGDPSGSPVGARVLVVEDNPVNQMLVTRQLERLGYEAVVVDSGADALALFPGASVDAVLMDWQMPDLDGLETTRQLRHREATETRVPVVAMTASALAGDRARCLEAGMDDFLAKPVSLATLAAALSRWIPKRRPVHAAAKDAMSSGPGVPVDDGTSPLDHRVLGQLIEELADTRLFATVARTYLRELPVRVAGISEAAAAGEREVVHALAHTLKSTSATLGATRLAEMCADLEARSVTGTGPVALSELWFEEQSSVGRALAEELDRIDPDSPA